MASSSLITTYFLVSNLHCPSCVLAIESALMQLTPHPASISSSIVSSWVTVRHDSLLPVTSMLAVLQDDGYEIVSVTSDETEGAVNAPRTPTLAGTSMTDDRWHTFSPKLKASKLKSKEKTKSDMELEMMRARHMEKCEICRSSSPKPGEKFAAGAFNHKKIDKADGDMTTSSHDSDNSDANSFVLIDSGAKEPIWRATFAIGGMTCQSCVDSVKQGPRDLDYVKELSVSLVNASATIDFTGKEHIAAITKAIEDMGFEVKLHDVINRSAHETVERVVEIKVDGMFCDSCPARVHQALDIFASQVHVEKDLRLPDPIIKIRYTPSQPNVTIRKIVDAISHASDKFKVSIYHPPTLEQLSARLHRKERNRNLSRVLLNVIIAIPTFIIGIVYMSLVPSSNTGRRYLAERWVDVSRSQWALFILATPVYFYSAGLFHERTIREVYALWKPGSKTPILRRFYRFGSMNMLMSLGTSIAYISSLAELISSSVSKRMASDSSFYFDTVVFLTMFVMIGRLIEAYSKGRTGDAISMLGKLRPTEALLVETDAKTGYPTKIVNVELLEFGDIVQISRGESPPSDGIITKGESSFDESSLTGESRLVKKIIGDQVFAGTVNKDGPMTIKITGVAGNSMLDQIVNAVRDGQTQHAPIEKLADSLTAYFVPAIVCIAILTWIVWLSLGLSGILPNDYKDDESDSWAVWSLGLAIAVFVVACPCGIGLAAPTALVVGSGLAAQNGILAKGGGEAFEKASRLDCIVFDKTGTLTVGGEPVVTDTHMPEYIETNFEHKKHSTIFSMMHKLEESTSHPVAKAIISYCKKYQLEDISTDSIEEIAGKGMKGFLTSKDEIGLYMLAGNEALMSDHSVQIDIISKGHLELWKSQGKSVVLVAGRTSATSTYTLIAIFAISDPVRPESAGLIKDLQKSGIDVWLLSGDNPTTAAAIGAQVCIPSSHIIAGVLPTQKAEKIKYLQQSLSSRGRKRRALIAMVGDGINDAPALAAADVGIAIGSGSDIAISAADFVLVSSDLRTVNALLDLSRLVFRRIKFNFAWALVYNCIGVPIAAGALLCLRSGGGRVRLQPVWASLAMALSSVSVVVSSLALRSGVPGVGFRRR